MSDQRQSVECPACGETHEAEGGGEPMTVERMLDKRFGTDARGVSAALLHEIEIIMDSVGYAEESEWLGPTMHEIKRLASRLAEMVDDGSAER